LIRSLSDAQLNLAIAALVNDFTVWALVFKSGAPQGEIHRVDPDFGSTLTAANRDSQSSCWVNWKIVGQPCEFQVLGPLIRAVGRTCRGSAWPRAAARAQPRAYREPEIRRVGPSLF
jgi:hypothetical protein